MKQFWGFILLFLGLGTFAMAANQPADLRPVVRIGITAPLTGEMALTGEDITAWVNRAMEELQTQSTHYRYELFVDDDQLQPQQTVLAVRRLVGWNKVNVLLTYGSGPGVAVASYANSVKIPHMAVSFDSRATAGDYNVSFLTPISGQAPLFLDMLKKKGYHRIAIFAVRSATWQPVLDVLRHYDESGGIKITYERIYVPGERDFRLGFQQMPQDKVDAVVFLSWSPEINILARQAREQKINKPIVSLGGSFIFSSERGNFDGNLEVYFGNLEEANRLNLKMTGHTLYGAVGPLMHDEILMLADIYENLSKHIATSLPTSEQVMVAIKDTKEYKGILGTSVYHADKYFYLPVNVYRIEKNSFRLVRLEDL